MHRNIAIAAALTLCLVATAPAENAEVAHVDGWLASGVASGEIAAAVVAEIDVGGIRVRGQGRRAADEAAPDAHTQFQIGSITKVYTHLLLAEMDADGVAGYRQSIGELLPQSFRPRNPAVAAITLEALATHTGGLPRLPSNLGPDQSADPYARYSPRELQADLSEVRARQPLGNYYSYSNFGVGLLGYLLGTKDGAGYRDAVSRRVIAPLHLKDLGFAPTANAAVAVSAGKAVKPWTFTDAMAGAGALWGSANDLGLLMQAYLGSHEHALKHDLERDLEVVRHDAGNFAVTRVWHVSDAAGQPIYWHNGQTAGFHAFVGFRPDQQRGVAILLSGDADPTLPGLKALGFSRSAPPDVSIDRSIFGQYQLSKQFGIGVFELDGVLVAQASGQPALALNAVGNDWYALGEVDASIHLVRKADQVEALELVQNGVIQRARRSAATATAAARSEIDLDAATLAEYVGSYSFAPGAVLTVKRVSEGLQAQLTGQPFFPIHARARDHFFYKVVDAELKFERDRAGKVDAVVLHQGGSRQHAPKS